MPDITKIKIGNERERSYKDFPANREFKKRAEDDNPGGGGWPSDLPKPSVGGYGYTESGEQTVITWDGDTEGKVSFVIGDAITIYKVSEVPQNYTPSALFNKVVFDSVDYDEIDSTDMTTQYGVIGYFSIAGNWQFYICVDSEKASAIGITETGVYFPKAENRYVSLASYGTPDTIHKIDEKYMPEADGGVMVVNISEDDSGNLLSDKTLQEIDNAYEKGGAIVAICDEIAYNMISASKGRVYIFNSLKLGYSDPDSPSLQILNTQLKIYVIDGDNETLVSKNTWEYDLQKYDDLGGAMVVNFTMDSGGIESDKTIEEIQTAMLTMPVVGVLSAGGITFALGSAIGWLDVDTIYSGVAFMPCYSQDYISGNSPHYMVRSTEDGWTSDSM